MRNPSPYSKAKKRCQTIKQRPRLLGCRGKIRGSLPNPRIPSGRIRFSGRKISAQNLFAESFKVGFEAEDHPVSGRNGLDFEEGIAAGAIEFAKFHPLRIGLLIGPVDFPQRFNGVAHLSVILNIWSYLATNSRWKAHRGGASCDLFSMTYSFSSFLYFLLKISSYKRGSIFPVSMDLIYPPILFSQVSLLRFLGIPCRLRDELFGGQSYARPFSR